MGLTYIRQLLRKQRNYQYLVLILLFGFQKEESFNLAISIKLKPNFRTTSSYRHQKVV